MEKFIHRQNTTLEYLHNEGLSTDSPPYSKSSSDEMDFNDVFGGPPRRFSMQEVRARCSFSPEKPVFGEESNVSCVVRRRKCDDFFGDIFGGDDTIYSSSPTRRIDRDRDKHEDFSASLPAQFSLPKAPEFPASGPRNHTCSSLSRFSNRANREIVDGNKPENQFHFSIYKWAATDVAMLIPLLSGKSRKDCNKFGGSAEESGLLRSFEVGVKENVSNGEEKINAAEEELPVEGLEKVNEVETLDKDDIEMNDVVRKEPSESLKSRAKSKNPGFVENMKKNERDHPKRDENLEKPESQGNKKSGVKGKIRDFVQKFNQEAADSSIKSNDVRKGSRSYRWRPVSVHQKENKPDVNIPKEEEKLSSENHQKDQKNVTFNKVENKDEKKQNTDTKTPSYRTSHSSASNNKNENFSSDPRHRDSKASMDNDPLEYHFLVQELSDDHQKSTQEDESSEDIKALDAKIHQWSVGKKGNIRSLLSTLQYVLWQGSGWQPIALVDLIESNSVKRAYQKALLRVHPDKLQQKGAPNDHKYIAEKVLDILQEAWDHFNTLGL